MLRFSEHIAWCTKPVQLDYIVGILWAGLVLAAGLIGNVGLAQAVTIAAVEQAQVLWLAVNTLKHALGGSNELIGGLWIDECCRQPNLIDFICNSDVAIDTCSTQNNLSQSPQLTTL